MPHQVPCCRQLTADARQMEAAAHDLENMMEDAGEDAKRAIQVRPLL
jgi:hypothetical protein